MWKIYLTRKGTLLVSDMKDGDKGGRVRGNEDNDAGIHVAGSWSWVWHR